MKIEASPHLRGKFEVVGVVPGTISLPRLGEIDLRTCTLEEAEKFVNSGKFPFLKPITAEKKEK